MSGVNLAAGINNKDYLPANLNVMTVAAQQGFIRDFCDRNPLKDFREAVDTLLGNIRSTKSGKVAPWQRSPANTSHSRAEAWRRLSVHDR